MKTNHSQELLEKIVSLTDKKIDMVLRSGEVISGMITGFIGNETGGGEGRILKWRIAGEDEGALLGTDPFGFTIGRTIDHKAIAEVRFRQDQTVMKFSRD